MLILELGKYNFQQLAPINHAKLEIYKDTLDYVSANKEIKNIALTGLSGAGKSSVLKTYEHETQEQNKFLYVSLATLSNTKNGDTLELDTEQLKNKILYQLRYQVDKEKIPAVESKSNALTETNGKAIVTTGSVLLFLISSLGVYSNRFTAEIAGGLEPSLAKSFLQFTTSGAWLVLEILLAAGCFTYSTYSIIKALYNKSLERKRIKQQELMKSKLPEEEFYSQQFIGEALYLIKAAGVNGIVFDDIDTIEDRNLLTQLKEINFLLNKQLEKNSDIQARNTIKFYYIMQDNVLDVREKTKFFDFILPVVPVVDNTNAFDQIVQLLQKGNAETNPDRQLIKELSLYIDDMNILKNIYNEFVVYTSKIKTKGLSMNKMFALMVYKTIFPEDFELLQKNQGVVATILKEKPALLKQLQEPMKTEHLQLQNELEQVKQEYEDNLKQLDAMYFTNNWNITVAGQKESSFPSRGDFLAYLKQHPTEIYINGVFDEDQKVLQALRDLDNIEDYSKLKADMVNNYEQTLNTLQSKLYTHKKEMQQLEIKKISEYITKDHIAVVVDRMLKAQRKDKVLRKTVKSGHFELIEYLLLNGYIEEDYIDYVTYFYGEYISANDKLFIKSVVSKEGNAFNYPVNNPDAVVDFLEAAYFYNPETLNFSLVNFLLENAHQGGKIKDCLENVLNQLKENKRVDFLLSFLRSEFHPGNLVKAINEIWPQIIKDIMLSQNPIISKNELSDYVLQTLYVSSDDTLLKLNQNGIISEIIIGNDNFLNIPNPQVELLIQKFKLLQIKFVSIHEQVDNFELVNAIYKNNLYDINYKTINFFLKLNYSGLEEEGYTNQNYSYIKSKPDEPLAKYIDAHMEDYMVNMLSFSDEEIIDEEKDAIELLNRTDISLTIKQQYIDRLYTLITDITTIEHKKLWRNLVENSVAEFTTENLMTYYFEQSKKVDTALVEIINTCPDPIQLDYDLITDTYGDENRSKFFNELICTKDIDNKKYEEMVSGLNTHFDNFIFRGLAPEKVEILVTTKVITPTTHNLLFLREEYPTAVEAFISENAEAYSKLITKELFNFDELVKYVLTLDRVVLEDNYKIALLQFTKKPISIIAKRYYVGITSHILHHNFEIDDLAILVSQDYYTDSPIRIQEDVQKLCGQHIQYIIQKQICVNFELLNILIEEKLIKLSEAKKVTANSIHSYQKDDVINILEALQEDNLEKALHGEYTVIENTKENFLISKQLQDKEWISSYSVIEDKNLIRLHQFRKTKV